jgi:hypothetical protein
MLATPIAAVIIVALFLTTLLLALHAIGSSKHRRSGEGAPPDVHAGDYVASDGRLYRIAPVRRQRVLIEDCRSGELFDAGVADVSRLRVVKCADAPAHAQR